MLRKNSPDNPYLQSQATTTPNLQVTLEIGDSLSLQNSNSHPILEIHSARIILCYVWSLDPLELEKIRKKPSIPLEVERNHSFLFGPLIPNQIP